MIDETVDEIRAMRTHSSSAVAAKAARALTALLDREYESVENFRRDLERNAGVLRRANPSHASLNSAMREIERSAGDAPTVADAKASLEAAIDRVTTDLDRAKHEAAARAAEGLADGDAVLTHDYSTTVLAAVEDAVGGGASLSAYVTEARPRYLGRKAARALADVDGVNVRLVVDGAMGYALRQVDRVFLGITCIADGTYYNRIGTLPLVATADRLDVPVTAVGSARKLVDEGRFETEFRGPVEVIREPIDGVTVENPAYDATPVELVDRVVTDEGTRAGDDLA